MRLFIYVVRYDAGFAPNPFHDYCTLATCKPKIRRMAKAGHDGDWVVGINSAKVEKTIRLVYVMRVTEALTFQEYWDDPRFQSKKPDCTGKRTEAIVGDNIYRPDGTGWEQLPSLHSNRDGTPNLGNIEHDTQTNRVLVSNQFCYWGAKGPAVPAAFLEGGNYDRFIRRGRNHLLHYSSEFVDAFTDWTKENCQNAGRIGPPTLSATCGDSKKKVPPKPAFRR